MKWSTACRPRKFWILDYFTLQPWRWTHFPPKRRFVFSRQQGFIFHKTEFLSRTMLSLSTYVHLFSLFPLWLQAFTLFSCAVLSSVHLDLSTPSLSPGFLRQNNIKWKQNEISIAHWRVTRWRSWLRHYLQAGRSLVRLPMRSINLSIDLNIGSTQPLTEVSTMNLLWG
jgi:hypothetical protein